MSQLSRRRFLSDSTIAAAVLAAGPGSAFRLSETRAAGTAGSPNDVVSVMVCGVRSRGWTLTEAFARIDGCRIKYICDVDEAIGQRRIDQFEKKYGYRPAFVRDLRKGPRRQGPGHGRDRYAQPLARPGPGFWAMRAGKDVYVEKPVSHNICEGQRLVETARKYKKICQTGTQSRSLEGAIAAVD